MNGLIRHQNLTVAIFHLTIDLLQQTEKLESTGKRFHSVQKIDSIWKRAVGSSPGNGTEKKPRTGIENYALLEDLWKIEKMKTFRDFLRWYNNKDGVLSWSES